CREAASGAGRSVRPSGDAYLSRRTEVLPLARHRPEVEPERATRQRLGAGGLLPQRHARFTRRAVTLLRATRVARGDDVLPGGATTLGARRHVVVRQLAAFQPLEAVLTSEVVPQVYVTARKADLSTGAP